MHTVSHLYNGKQSNQSRVVQMELDGKSRPPVVHCLAYRNVRLAILTGLRAVRISKSWITITYYHCIPTDNMDIQTYLLPSTT